MPTENKPDIIISRIRRDLQARKINLKELFLECHLKDLQGKIVFQECILKFMEETLKTSNFIDFHMLLEHLKRKDVLNFLDFPINFEIRDAFEKIFHGVLTKCLNENEFEFFEELLKIAKYFNVFLDLDKISNRFEILSESIRDCLIDVSESYQTERLGDIIDIIRFYNKFGLLEKRLTEADMKLIQELKKDPLFIANLKDLFSSISDFLIYHVRKELPRILYDFFVNNPNPYFPEAHALIHYVKEIFFNQYAIYGLSVKNLGSVKKFIEDFKDYCQKKKLDSKWPVKIKEKTLENEEDFIEFEVEHVYRRFSMFQLEIKNSEYKRHLISPLNLRKNYKKIVLGRNYNFLCISMVLLGGLGPQGHGFTYSTPRGELVEICSDRRENDAIIVQYKQFLKMQFLNRLRKELIKLNIHPLVIEKINKYLLEILNDKERITIYRRGEILKEITKYLLEEREGIREETLEELDVLMKKISDAITIILRPIDLVDQFKCRINLILEGKIKAEEVAKLTSLRGKSHYDVLRERFFYQYIIEWFYQLFVLRRNDILNTF
ncbi:MAG: hypothetical protein ACTSUN_10110 [Promethearchaeota archaeon]